MWRRESSTQRLMIWPTAFDCRLRSATTMSVSSWPRPTAQLELFIVHLVFDMDATPHFSDAFQAAIAASREHAIRLGNNFIGPEHIVLGVISGGTGTARRILSELADVTALSQSLEADVHGRRITQPQAPPDPEFNEEWIVLSPEAEAIIHEAMVSSKSVIVSGEHVIATMLRMENPGRGVLNAAGITSDTFGSRLD